MSFLVTDITVMLDLAVVTKHFQQQLPFLGLPPAFTISTLSGAAVI
jgi:hypothetical protein